MRKISPKGLEYFLKEVTKKSTMETMEIMSCTQDHSNKSLRKSYYK